MPIKLIAARNLGPYRCFIGWAATLQQLSGAPPRPLFERSKQIDLEWRIWHDNTADIAPNHNDPAALADRPLARPHDLADTRVPGNQ